jgi:4-diphosphocytidyl-2-C-methyl-D-erythritol kinase
MEGCMSEALRMLSPAKVNLHLAVGRVRPDGFHDLETVFQSLELADRVTLEPSDGLALETDTDLQVPAEENLAVMAARVFAEQAGVGPDVRITLTKAIPAGAGLGGGSSNAAAVIAGLATMWEIPAGDPRLHAAAAAIGADVPFFLEGGTGIYEGRGDVLTTCLPTPDLDVVVVWPGTPVSTAKAYMALDDDAARIPAPPVSAIVDAIESNDASGIAGVLHNDFTSYSAGMVEVIGEALAWLGGARGVMGAAMAGSGSGVFGICESADAARELAADACSRGWWAVATRSSARGAHLIDDGRESM